MGPLWSGAVQCVAEVGFDGLDEVASSSQISSGRTELFELLACIESLRRAEGEEAGRAGRMVRAQGQRV